MARTQSISQNYALLVGPSPATGVHGSSLNQLWALQSLNWSQTNPKQPVQIYGKGAPIGRETVESPQVNLSFSYLVTSIINEYYALGFNPTGTTQALSNILAGSNHNFFIFKAPEGSDAIGLSGSSSNIHIYGLGNCFLTSYSIEASVGNFPTASVQFQGVNVESYTGGVSQTIPAVDEDGNLIDEQFTIPTITDLSTGIGAGSSYAKTVLKPGDITVTLSDAGGFFEDYNNPCIQSFRMSFDLSRNPINCLGTKFATSRSIQFPVDVNFEVEMLSKDATTGSLAQYLCQQTGDYSASISMKLPTCDGGSGSEVVGIKLLGLSLEEQSWNPSLGGEPATLTTRWIGQIGGANDNTRGFFISGQPD